MKKRLFSTALVLLMVAVFIQTFSTASFASEPLTDDLVYKRMIALKNSYPEGMKWTDDNYYEWNVVLDGYPLTTYGYGCAAFAYILSDAAFGDLPARKHTDFNSLKVGDIVRIGGDTHSVVVLKIDARSITIAEGNYNSSIHWGRVYTKERLKSVYDYITTRYTQVDSTIPDIWAKASISAAQTSGLLPDSVAKAGWRNSTSRLAAADAIVMLIEKASGKTMTQVAADHGWDLKTGGFSDTNSEAVTFLKYAGVTAGVGNNMYDPDGDYNRAQVVTMIGRTAEVFFGVTTQGVNPFTDVPDYAAPYVAYAAENNITQGVGGNKFDPYGTLQNQHMAVFSYRAFMVWK